MSEMEFASIISLTLSLLSLVLLTLTAVPRCLGETASRLSPYSISLVLSTSVRSALATVDYVAGRQGGTNVLCSVDSVLVTYLTTALVAHIPVIALHLSSRVPLPSRPTPRSIQRSRVALVLVALYTYSLLPLIPTFISSIPSGPAFGVWWGTYCSDDASWTRIVRPSTLLPPLVITLIIVAMSVATLYGQKGYPDPDLRPTILHWAQQLYLLGVTALLFAYLIVEQVSGWRGDWWPRVFESCGGILVFVPLACDLRVWQRYQRSRLLRLPIRNIEADVEGRGTWIGPPAAIKTLSGFHRLVDPPRLAILPSAVMAPKRATIGRSKLDPTLAGLSTASPPFVYSTSRTVSSAYTSDSEFFMTYMSARNTRLQLPPPLLRDPSTSVYSALSAYSDDGRSDGTTVTQQVHAAQDSRTARPNLRVEILQDVIEEEDDGSVIFEGERAAEADTSAIGSKGSLERGGKI